MISQLLRMKRYSESSLHLEFLSRILYIFSSSTLVPMEWYPCDTCSAKVIFRPRDSLPSHPSELLIYSLYGIIRKSAISDRDWVHEFVKIKGSMATELQPVKRWATQLRRSTPH